MTVADSTASQTGSPHRGESIDREHIVETHQIIQSHIRRTPVVKLRGSDLGIDHPQVVAKLELLQCSGSFKARGAFANLLRRDVPEAGVIAASGGNHGAAEGCP